MYSGRCSESMAGHTNSPVYPFSWQTAILSGLRTLVFGLLTDLQFGKLVGLMFHPQYKLYNQIIIDTAQHKLNNVKTLNTDPCETNNTSILATVGTFR